MAIKDFNYFEVYLTLRCNFKCPYCINADGLLSRKREELTAKQWVEAINRIDFGSLPLTLGGGEPTLHPEFYDIINGIKPEVELNLLTNLSFNVVDFIFFTKKTAAFRGRDDSPAYKSIRVSYHPKQMNAKDLLDKIVLLQRHGYSVGLFGINHPENTEANIIMSELARQSQVYFFIKDFLGDYGGNTFGYYKYPDAVNGKPKRCKCKTQEVLVAPDGLVYKCHHDIYAQVNSLGSITDKSFEFVSDYRPCDSYGFCNPCDIKIKTNRFLQMGQCSVDIRNVT